MEITKIDKEIERLQELKQELLDQDFIEIEHNKKTFRIYKWENKPVGTFKYPKGFRMAEFQEFIDLVDSKKYKLKTWIYHWVKHFSKLQQDKEYCLSGVYFDGDGDVGSGYGVLKGSFDVGRVVVVKNKEIQNGNN
ncbi:hypothetical protein K9M79_02920 [Candidatus Woesearchaeota archaeon]|nr:hypothetical protein [Candidatus Woesearchaeota archaeon]